jgi:hypothetical protein
MKAHRVFVVISLMVALGMGMAFADGDPIKVFILSGQSNMVGFGRVAGGGVRWGKEMIDPVVSVYEGKYDPTVDYDALEPVKTLKLEAFGGTKPTPYPEGEMYVTRGYVQVKEDGVYQFRPGYGSSQNCIMEVDGQEVHRQNPGEEAVRKNIKLSADRKVPFKITYLTNQANGLGWTERVDPPGSLSTLVLYQGMYPYLIDEDGQWVKRDDVYYKGVVADTGSRWLGTLDGTIGPELGFGIKVGDALDTPVLLLKTSQGNRALGWDFLPPGSPRYDYDGYTYAGYKDSPMKWEKGTEPKPINWYAGKQYDDCFGAAHAVLDNFDQQFPHWKGRGYEIVGFAWWQGDKDRYDAGLASRYETNLVHLIKTLRAEFKAPDAKFVVATLGQTAKDAEITDSSAQNEKWILDAQLAVDGSTGKYPEFKGNVGTVYTHPLSQGGASNSHYNRHAQTYMEVGLSMGDMMVELLGKE